MTGSGVGQPMWWYQKDDGETAGPVGEAELRRLLAANKLQSTSLVWQESYGEDWRSIADAEIVSAVAPAGNVSEAWKKTFARIEAQKESPPKGLLERLKQSALRFSILGYLFGPFYYFYLRMWSKGLLLLALAANIGIVESLLHLAFSTPETIKALDALVLFICAFQVKDDYYRYKVHGETMWPWKPFKRLDNPWAALAAAAGAFVLLLLIPAEATSANGILGDLSGVWGTNGLTLAVDLVGSSKKLVINGRPIDVSVKGSSEDAVSLTPTTKPNEVMTITRRWGDAAHKGLNIAFSLEGRSMTLGYQYALAAPERQASSSSSADTTASKAGISGSYCASGKGVLLNVIFRMRDQSIPIDDALNTFLKEDNADYQNFMMMSVRQLYENPDDMRQKLDDGIWMRACIMSVRGF